jgi:two-component system cell cycle sensor histidine kinase/response regulator CckA
MSIPKNDTKTVLVIDDQPSVLIVVKAMLESGLSNVLLAQDADSALRLVESENLPIDLILTDVTVRDTSGIDLANRILAVRPGVKLMFMSAFVDGEVVRVKLLEQAPGELGPLGKDGLVECVRRKLADSSSSNGRPKTMTAGA